MKTEKLGIEFDMNSAHIGGRWKMDNLSGGYHGIIRVWCEHFGLEGFGLVVGESGSSGESVKTEFLNKFPDIKHVWSVDLNGADYNWDITRQDKRIYPTVDINWIVCCATLEHVISPTEAVGNFAGILAPGGRMFLHAPGPNFIEHRYPIDCFRFLRDALIGWSERFDLEIDDMLWSPNHWFVVYRKK